MDKTVARKPIEGFNNYEVEWDGRIWSNRSRKYMTPAPQNKGYLTVGMRHDSGRGYRKTVHSIVAHAFIGPRPAGKTIDHKDGNKLNNRADNLRYLSNKDNNSIAWEEGRNEKNRVKLTRGQVLEIKRNKLLPKSGRETWVSMARRFGVCVDTIHYAASGRTHKNIAT